MFSLDILARIHADVDYITYCTARLALPGPCSGRTEYWDRPGQATNSVGPRTSLMYEHLKAVSGERAYRSQVRIPPALSTDLREHSDSDVWHKDSTTAH